MERVYSAFFTSPPSNNLQLTAETLAQHNQNTQQSSLSVGFYPYHLVGSDQKHDLSNGHDNLSISPTTDAVDARPFDASVRSLPSVTSELRAAIKAALRAGVLAYGAKAFTAFLLASRRWHTGDGYLHAIRLLLQRDTIRFGGFVSCFVASFRITELSSRHWRHKKDKWNLVLAGGISGLSLLVDAKHRRSTIALYLCVRMMEVYSRQFKGLKYGAEWGFAISNAMIVYAFIVDPTLLPKVSKFQFPTKNVIYLECL